MTYTSFSDAFLLAAYQESLRKPHDLTVGDVLDAYNLKGKPGWAEQSLEEFSRRGFVEDDPTLSDERQLAIIFKGAGLREAGRMLANGLHVLPRTTEIQSIVEATDAAAEFSPFAENPTSNGVEIRIDSSSWTGLPSNFELTEQKQARLGVMLGEAERNLDAAGAGNHEKAMARAYIVAAKSLADAPEPPLDLIWEIIGRANSISGIASLLVSIIALFVTN